MSTTGKIQGAFRAGEGLAGLQRFWPLAEGVSGYGVASYIGTTVMTSRIYNLHTSEMLAMQRVEDDYLNASPQELKNMIGDMLGVLAEQAGIPMSKLSVAVVSGTTGMEGKAAGIDPNELQGNLEEELEEFGRDVEYMFAGATEIAVGSAYFVPCLSSGVGGDILCSLLAINILQAEKPLFFVNTCPQEGHGVVLAYGDKDAVSVCAIPEGTSAEEGMRRLLELCEAECSCVDRALVMGSREVSMPAELVDRIRHVGNAAIEGASAVLLSEVAEDELCRIASACRVVEL